MTALRRAGPVLLLISLVIGSLSEEPRTHPQLDIGGYHVLAADFHVHNFPLSWGVLTPWDTVAEARRQGLDVIALTPHNEEWMARAGRWFSGSSGEPMVLLGEEIHSIDYHVLGVGISSTISWRQPAARAIDEIHRQGGIAIAAHPTDRYARGYDSEAMQKLDGAEVMHPLVLTSEVYANQMRQFLKRAPLAAIGDSDYHLGPLSPDLGAMGICRTYVFTTERTEKGVLDALRHRQTVVYDREHVYGDPALIDLAAKDGRLPEIALTGRQTTVLELISRIAGFAGLLLCIKRI